MTYRFLLALLIVGSADIVRADGLTVPPVTSLPTTPSAPYLWFDATDAPTLTDLRARRSDPRTAGYFATLRAYVDARLATITSANDDTRSRFVKAAGVLQVLGEVPPGGPYTSYRDAAVVALKGVGTRQALNNIAYVISPPPNLVNILQDASLLQSLAEGYDFLRGSGVAPADDATMRARLANWADAIRLDWNLVGAFGYSPHRDNWAIKAGSALLTVALAMPDHPTANTWRDRGMAFVTESLEAVASTTGWYRESVWYLNYSLANLFSTAWQVRQTTGIDWFPALRPFVLASFAWRQPDGRAPPFEEGVPNTFPWDVVASAYPDLAPQMLWAWDTSDQNDENYENQQFHEVTRFIVSDLTTLAAAPEAAATRFIGGDARIYALANGWDDQALQVTGIAAVDHSTSEAFASRHNMRNPLDLVLHAAGGLLVPTASGGPTVTSSGTRATYLSVLAKNLPLVAKAAPFLTASDAVYFGDRLDSADEGGRDNHLADLVRTEVAGAYAAGSSVTRSVALVDDDYVIVADRIALASASEVDLSWRGRGNRTTRSDTSTLQSFTWQKAGLAPLDLDVVASVPLSLESNASLYADGYGQEEPIAGVLVGGSAATSAYVSVFQIGSASRSVTSIGNTDAAAARVTGATFEDTIVVPASLGVQAAGGVATDGAMALVRKSNGLISGVCLQHGTVLVVDGRTVIAAEAPLTLCLTVDADGFVAEVSPDTAGVSFVVDLPSIDGTRSWQGSLEGNALDAASFEAGAGGLSFVALGSGTLEVSGVACDPSSCPGPAVFFGTVRNTVSGELGAFRCTFDGSTFECDENPDGTLHVDSVLACGASTL